MNFEEDYFSTVYKNYTQQNPARKLRFYRRLLARHLDPPPSPYILELGCGPGFFLQSMDDNWRKFGLDASHFAVKEANRRVPHGGLVVGDCSIPPFARQFHAIVAFDVLEHVMPVDQVAEFVTRSLAPGGVFLFVVPVYDGPLGPAVHWLDKDPTHVHKRSRHWWLEWTRRNFEIADWTGMVRYLVAPGCYVHIHGKALRGISPAIAIVAKLPRR